MSALFPPNPPLFSGLPESEQAGGAGGHEGDDERIEALQLGAGELSAPPQLAQRDAGGVADGAAAAGPQRGRLGDQGSDGVLG